MKEEALALAGALTVEAEVKAGETDPEGAMAEEIAERDPQEREAAGALAVQVREVEREGRMVAVTDVTTEPGVGARGTAARAQSPKVMKQTK